MLGTFEKARAVLDLYTTEHPEWGVTEAARRLGIPVSSTHLLMSSLTQMGLLHRTVAGRYRLGFKLLALSQVLLSNTPWREVAGEVMQNFFGHLGETLYLAAFDGGQIVNVAKFAGRHADSIQLAKLGAVLPAGHGAASRVLLAHRPWELVRQVLMDPKLPDPLPAELLDAAAAELEQVRLNGEATCQSAAGSSWSVAAPVFNHNGEVIAAVGFIVPADRSPERREALRMAVREAGQRISHRIGYTEVTAEERRLVWLSVRGQDRLQLNPRRGRGRGSRR